MKIIASDKPFAEIETDVLILPVSADDAPDLGLLAQVNTATNGLVAAFFEAGVKREDRFPPTLFYTGGSLAAKRLLLYGVGKSDTILLALQRTAGEAVRKLSSDKLKTAAFMLPVGLAESAKVQAIVEGTILGALRGNLYHTDGTGTTELESLTMLCEAEIAGDLERAIQQAIINGEAVNFARKLAFEPGNVLTPTRLAEFAAEMCEREGLGFEALDEETMKQMGMGALLGVSRGSEEQARLIIMKHEPAGVNPAELIALVGKGITFDSGGISIKPGDHMEDMKYDMGGGAAVIGAMQIIARRKPNARVLGIVAASENLPSGRAYKPGDVLRSFSGKTIEVINTDAEGRLVLADAITYAATQGATKIIDIATLTGAVSVALHDIRAAVMGTNQELIDELMRAGEETGELLWQLPFDKDYAALLKSDIADIKNLGGRTAGAITGGMFLKPFADPIAWAHLDIGGTGYYEEEKPYMAKGATGFGARLLSNYVMRQAAKSSPTPGAQGGAE